MNELCDTNYNYMQFILQAVTQELREQTALLQITKAEIQRLKAPLASTSTTHSNSTSVFPTSTPPPSLTTSTASDKKQDNNTSLKAQPIQGKRRQIEDLVRKVSILFFFFFHI